LKLKRLSINDVPINRNRESVESVLLRVSASVKNVRNSRSDNDYFTVALIMKMIVTSIQLNSQINQENSYTNLSTKNFDFNVITSVVEVQVKII